MEKTTEEMQQADMPAASLAGAAAPKETWFFERGRPGDKDYLIFPVEEREAWDLLNNRSTWKRQDFRLLGTSDGTTYNRIVKEAMSEAKKLEPEIAKLKAEVDKYVQMEDRFIMSEVVDMEDLEDPVNAANVAKVKRMQKIRERLQGSLASLEEAYRSATAQVVNRATEAEYQVALKNGPKAPRAMNIITPEGRREEIVPMMKYRG